MSKEVRNWFLKPSHSHRSHQGEPTVLELGNTHTWYTNTQVTATPMLSKEA